MDQHPSIPSSLSTQAFSQASRQRCLKRYPKTYPRRSSKKKTKKAFSKRFQKFSFIENLHHHYRNISNSYLRYFYQINFPSKSFSHSSRFSPFSPDSTRREMAARIFMTDTPRSEIERGRRFLMHRSLTIRNRKWDTNERDVRRRTLHGFFRRKKGKR